MRKPLPPFEGWPYLVTLVTKSLHHLILLPSGLTTATLVDLAREQVHANRLPTCLVLGRAQALYLSEERDESWSTDLPPGAFTVAGKLRLSQGLVGGRELEDRRRDLEAHVRRHAATGYRLGDLSKGGRRPTRQEQRLLTGQRKDGVRMGLERCGTCRDWRGRCLDKIADHGTLLVAVDCRCANDNRCARCGGLLHERRLNANFYEAETDTVWHVPGFCGLDHRCLGKSGNADTRSAVAALPSRGSLSRTIRAIRPNGRPRTTEETHERRATAD